MNTLAIIWRLLDDLGLLVAIVVVVWTAVVRYRSDRAQLKTIGSMQDIITTQGQRITNAVGRIAQLEAAQFTTSVMLGRPAIVPPAADRWGAHDQALERLRIEIDEIEDGHQKDRDHDSHEPGS